MFRTAFTANGKNDHVTMFNFHLPLTVSSISVSGLAFAFKARTILRYSYLCTRFFEENIDANIWRLPFAVNAILNLSEHPILIPPRLRNAPESTTAFDSQIMYMVLICLGAYINDCSFIGMRAVVFVVCHKTVQGCKG